MRIVLYSLISLLLMINFGISFAGEKEELQLRQSYLQEKMVRMETQFRLLQLEYPKVQQELEKVTQQLQTLDKQEKEVKK